MDSAIIQSKNKVDIVEIEGKLGIPLSQVMHILADQIDNIEDISCRPFTKDKISLTITFSMDFMKE